MQIRVIADIIESNLATRRDIKELDIKIESVKVEFQRDIKQPDQRMVIKSGSLLLATVGTMPALSKLKFDLT